MYSIACLLMLGKHIFVRGIYYPRGFFFKNYVFDNYMFCVFACLQIRVGFADWPGEIKATTPFGQVSKAFVFVAEFVFVFVVEFVVYSFIRNFGPWILHVLVIDYYLHPTQF